MEEGNRAAAIFRARVARRVALAVVTAFWVSSIAAVTAPAAAAGAGDDGATLQSVHIALDTSARSSPRDGVLPVTFTIEGLRRGERVALARGIALAIERDTRQPFVQELTLESRVRKEELDHVVTTLSTTWSTTDRFVFHYTLTLTFEGGGDDSVFVQKTYAVHLGAESPLAMTQTEVRRPPNLSTGATDSAVVPNAIERAYGELEAAYARMEEAIDVNGRVRAPIWMHYTLGSLRLDGDLAVIEVRQSFSRMERDHGDLRKVETGVTRDETWVKTRRGWKRHSSANETDLERYVDGQPVEPGAG